MAAAGTPLFSKLSRELKWLAALLFAGIVLLPVAIWFVGGAVFGDYEGYGYMDFFGAIVARLVSGQGAAWFLVLSPYLGIAAIRLAAWGYASGFGRPADGPG